MKRSRSLLLIIFILSCGSAFAQSSAITFQGKLADATTAQPTAFTYQGRLTDGGAAANGTYDFQFTLYDAASVNLGSAEGSLTVTNGIFTASIDGAAPLFTSSNPARFLEIGVRLSGGGSYTTLTPRQPITSSPYAMKALSATSADSITGVLGASQGGTGIGPTFPVADTFLRSNGAGWQASGLLPQDVPSGSTNYLQNLSVGQQSGSFNINGNGGANVFNAGTQYNIGGNRVLSVSGANNLFAGVGAGNANTIGFRNSFAGERAGIANTTGYGNSFFGQAAGESNTTGHDNTFIGSIATWNTTGSNNTLLGSDANVDGGVLNYATAIGSGALVSASNTVVLGRNADTVQVPGNFNVSGTGNANIFNAIQYNIGGNPVLHTRGVALNVFVGFGAGNQCHIGCYGNSFFGEQAGYSDYGGIGNSFFGHRAGYNSTGGNNVANSFFGSDAGSANTTGSTITAIGAGANVGSGALTNATAVGANSIVSLSDSLVLGSNNVKVGIGTSAPTSKLYVLDSSNTGLRVETGTSGGSVASFGGQGSFSVDAPFVPGGRLSIKENGNVGVGVSNPNAKLQVAGGSVYIQSPNSLIITSPNGACWFITVNNAGALSTISVACP
jgi:hypothetical protein